MVRKKESVRRQIVENMKELGVYSKEYRNAIDVFADMVYQYEVFTKEFEKNGCKVEEAYTNKAGATNMRKTPTYSAIEKLRMDMSTYSNLLCLNPKALENIKETQQNTSKLESVLNNLE